MLAGPLAVYASLSGVRDTRMVTVGDGCGGATTARYVRVFSGDRVDAMLVEPNTAFILCPLPGFVPPGDRDLTSITVPYDVLVEHHGAR